ncbi:cytochrome c oxidase subunit II [Microbulbifer sp. 2205BS26-8]|uniref:cytochrome c oxidase subunit II n=1 Tax=Microbulbifer sp. 2205BS26-8 TaxID=3064386 RepID=UPI0027401B9A|nr:cytochrome ubiquinol oxidase subunit II [Microbulbifer sp. 2205BS26-8]MDP5210031.1 cytochrome ubiquinol oxidase subunit II [Microbulbifer sp. 2205BS26-8]
MDWKVEAPTGFLQLSNRAPVWGFFHLPGPTFVLLLLLPCLLSPAQTFAAETFLVPLGPIAQEQKTHFLWVIALTMVAVFPVFILLPVILIKYRRKKGHGIYAPKWESYGPLELMMWGVPFMVILVLSSMLWRATSRLDPYQAVEGVLPPIQMQVVGLDWKWLFIYPDLGIATVGEMVIPVNTPVSMILTSDTVMQSFLIAALAGQIYVMPGMTTKLNFIASKIGETEGENTQFTGKGFADQKFEVLVRSEEDFQAWSQQVRAVGIELDTATYHRLAERSTRRKAHSELATTQMPARAIFFTLPNKQLFRDIVMRYHSGKPLSIEEQPGTEKFGRGGDAVRDTQP